MAQPGPKSRGGYTLNTRWETHILKVGSTLKHLSAACLDGINGILMKSTQKEFAGGVPETQYVSTLYNKMHVPIHLIHSVWE